MRTAILPLVLVALLAAAHPVEHRLREAMPETPDANRIGMGRLMGGVLTGPFRPMLQTYLWIRADILYGEGRFDELQVLYRTMTALYPNNPAAKDFVGWNICFNLKNEAPTPEIAWKWSRDGLDMLADLEGSYRQVADWFLKQCGQNPVPPMLMRYTGRAWANERAFRERARAWTKKTWGKELERFDAGLHALGDHTKFFDQLRRLSLLTWGAYDDCLRTGDTRKLGEAAALARWTAGQLDLEGAPAPEGWREHFEQRAWVYEQLQAGQASPQLVAMGEYPVAVAMWGLGAHKRDANLLQGALQAMRLFQKRLHDDIRAHTPEGKAPELPDYGPELDAIAAWIAYVADPQKQRPPLPFD